MKPSESDITEPEAGSLDVPSRTSIVRRVPWPPGIRGHLLLLVFTSILPLPVLAWINLEDRFKEQSQQARQHALTLARMASNRVDDHIRSVDALLVAIGKIISVKDSDSEFNDQFLRGIYKDLPPFFSSLGVFGPDGHGLGTSLLLTDRSRLTAAGREYLSKALTAGGLSIGEPVVSRTTGAWMSVISRPVMGPQGEVLALVYAAMRLDRMQVLLDPGKMPPGTILALIDEKGTILARTVDPEKWVGQATRGLCRPDMVTPFPAQEMPLARAMRGESVDNVEMFIRRLDLPPGIRVSATARPLRDSEGRILDGVVVLRDITHQHQLEEQLRQSQRMESIGKLAGGVAHDFNNLLTAILGYAALLLENLPTDSDARRDAEQIHKASERAAALTRQLLAFSWKQILQARLLDINAILLGMEPMLHRLIGEHIKLYTFPRLPLQRSRPTPARSNKSFSIWSSTPGMRCRWVES